MAYTCFKTVVLFGIKNIIEQKIIVKTKRTEHMDKIQSHAFFLSISVYIGNACT